MIKILKDSFLAKLLIADVGIVLLHILFAPGFGAFDLDVESNIPTVYQGLKLIIIGTIILTKREWSKLPRDLKLSVAFTAGFLIFLGADEMALIHENVPVFTQQMFPWVHASVLSFASAIGYIGSLWVIYALPIIGALIMVWTFQLAWLTKKKQDIRLILIAIILLVSVPAIEGINTSSGLSPEVYRYWIVIEEMVELIGVTLIATEYLKLHQRLFKGFSAKD